MSDLISRQAALDALIALTVYSNKRDLVKEADNHPNTWIEGVAECIDEIEDLPSAQPEPHWIPCSEKLPKVGRSVLLSRRSMDTREGCLQADGKWWQYRWNEILNANQVNAWMPLPEPYRAERRADAD